MAYNFKNKINTGTNVTNLHKLRFEDRVQNGKTNLRGSGKVFQHLNNKLYTKKRKTGKNSSKK